MTRREWYRSSRAGAVGFWRDVEAGAPWVCILLAMLALLIKWGGRG